MAAILSNEKITLSGKKSILINNYINEIIINIYFYTKACALRINHKLLHILYILIGYVFLFGNIIYNLSGSTARDRFVNMQTTFMKNDKLIRESKSSRKTSMANGNCNRNCQFNVIDELPIAVIIASRIVVRNC